MLAHTGAQLRGDFSRLDYQRGPHTSPSSFRHITGLLPKHASDIYYRDVIGNVSTSHVRKTRDHTHVELEPRYPMFGGKRKRYSHSRV